MKLGTDIHHVTRFSRSEVKGQGHIARPSELLQQRHFDGCGVDILSCFQR